MIEVNLNVSALIQDGGQWDVTKLDNTFHVNGVQSIRQLLVGEVPDRDIWAYSPHGAYTVKSGYKLAMQAKESQALQTGMRTACLLEMKKDIWNLPLYQGFEVSSG